MELPSKKFFRPLEVARHFGVTRRCIYGWIGTGKLPAIKVYGSLCIKRTDIVKLEKMSELKEDY